MKASWRLLGAVKDFQLSPAFEKSKSKFIIGTDDMTLKRLMRDILHQLGAEVKSGRAPKGVLERELEKLV